MNLFILFFIFLFAYLIGSLSSAVILCRLKGIPDPRTVGSKNPGATNVLRTSGKSLAAFVFLGDFIKGFIPVFLAKNIGIEGLALSIIALLVTVGHIFPIFFQFKGGKGIATAFGAILALSWPLGLAVASTWLVIAFLFRYSSLAGIIASLLMPFYSYWLSESDYIPPLLLLSLLILFRHHNNIHQLIKGNESRIKL